MEQFRKIITSNNTWFVSLNESRQRQIRKMNKHNKKISVHFDAKKWMSSDWIPFALCVSNGPKHRERRPKEEAKTTTTAESNCDACGECSGWKERSGTGRATVCIQRNRFVCICKQSTRIHTKRTHTHTRTVKRFIRINFVELAQHWMDADTLEMCNCTEPHAAAAALHRTNGRLNECRRKTQSAETVVVLDSDGIYDIVKWHKIAPSIRCENVPSAVFIPCNLFDTHTHTWW